VIGGATAASLGVGICRHRSEDCGSMGSEKTLHSAFIIVKSDL
jgi:hypothetical protein